MNEALPTVAPRPSSDGAASPRQRWRAQTRMELILTLRRGESVLLTFAIPVLLLGFFSIVDVLPTGASDSVDFLFPGVLALAVMSTAFVSVAIEVLQIVILSVEALLLGFRFSAPAFGAAMVAAALATIAFAGLALLLAGTLPALTTLAAANGIYLVLLLFSGMLIPLAKLPSGLRAFSQLLPSTALAEVFHGALGNADIPGHAWVVLLVWAVVAPVLAARWFRWE